VEERVSEYISMIEKFRKASIPNVFELWEAMYLLLIDKIM
jgi:hypothetical protein